MFIFIKILKSFTSKDFAIKITFMLTILKTSSYFFAMGAFALLMNIFLTGCTHQDWRTADKGSAGLAPLPEKESRAIVQVYAARTFGWRGYFAVHSWITYKEKNANEYVVHHVIGWRLRYGTSVISIDTDLPDRRWFGNDPELLLDLRGIHAEAAISKIKEAVESYPYPNEYRAYPGPNSNTFVAHIIRNVPELEVELPSNAIGKDWIGKAQLVGRSESGTGVQFSVLGLLGATVGVAEGVEVNVLGMSFGVDLLRPAVKLPFIGRLGFKDGQIFTHSTNEESVAQVDQKSSEKIVD